MDVFEEICNRLVNTSPQDITPHLMNAFINEVWDAICSDKEKLKNKNFLTLQAMSRVYSFFLLPEKVSVSDEKDAAAITEAYINGFLYGLTRLCEIVGAEESK